MAKLVLIIIVKHYDVHMHVNYLKLLHLSVIPFHIVLKQKKNNERRYTHKSTFQDYPREQEVD